VARLPELLDLLRVEVREPPFRETPEQRGAAIIDGLFPLGADARRLGRFNLFIHRTSIGKLSSRVLPFSWRGLSA
jgi:hypothetical protein